MIGIINGDCFKMLPKLIAEVKGPVIVTDPPFNIGYHYESYREMNGFKRTRG